MNTFKNCKKSTVVSTVDVNEILEWIGNGGVSKNLILDAREIGKDSVKFDGMKMQVPTFTTNATFDGLRKKEFYQKSTGMLYIDVDGSTDIDLSNELIYASWKSISGTGRGIMVSMDGITPDNIKPVYREVSNLLGIEEQYRDYSCGDITRQTVLSYDNDIYINNKSTTLSIGDLSISMDNRNIIETKKEGFKGIIEKKGEANTPLTPPFLKSHDSSIGYIDFSTIKYNNTHLVNLEGKPYRIFDEKESFVQFYIPHTIKTGKRYPTIMATMTQYLAVNPDQNDRQIWTMIQIINNRCDVPKEIPKLIEMYKNILGQKERDEIEPQYNMGRYLIMDKDLPRAKKYKLCGEVSGMVRIRNTKRKIQESLDDWDLNGKMKPTYDNIALASGVHSDTVKDHFKLNPDFKVQQKLIKENIKKSK